MERGRGSRWLRGTAFGFPFGAIPAGGAEIPTFLSFAIEKKLDQAPGRVRHAARSTASPAPESAANNASAAATWCRCWRSGCPPRATAAVMLAAFQQYGMQPGPLLFDTNPTWCGRCSRACSSACHAAGDQPAVGAAVGEAAEDPRPYLYAGILLFATLGVYAVNGSTVDLWLLLAIGCLGFAMRRFGLPMSR